MTINVPADAHERISSERGLVPPLVRHLRRHRRRHQLAPRSPAVSHTQVQLVDPTRGFSIRKMCSPTARNSPQQCGNARMMEFYNNYLDGYTSEEGNEIPPLSPGGEAYVANWANGVGAGCSGRLSTPQSSDRGSMSGGSVCRKLTRCGTAGCGPSWRAASSLYGGYEEEEEDYISGEYGNIFEMVKICVKPYHQEEARATA